MNIDELWEKYSVVEYAIQSTDGVMTKGQFTQAINDMISNQFKPETMMQITEIIRIIDEMIEYAIEKQDSEIPSKHYCYEGQETALEILKQKIKNKEQNSEKLDNSVSNDTNASLKFTNQTGKLMFKFDDDEPQECAAIYDYGEVTIRMQQQKDLNNDLQKIINSIEFTSQNGKRFRLFLENI